MQRSKKIYILLGVLIVVSAATFILTQVQEKQEDIKNSNETILEIAGDDVTALSWDYDGKTYSFTKTDGTWSYDDDEDFPVDEEKISEMLSIFEDFKSSFIIEDVDDYSQYGLKDPESTITITTEDKTYEIELGDYSKMDSERYLSIGDGNVYLAETDPSETYSVELDDVLADDETLAYDSVEKIKFSGEQNYTIDYVEDSTDSTNEDDVYFTKKDNKPLSTANVEQYLDNLSTLNLQEYVTYTATDDDLEKYGLDDPDLTVKVKYTIANDDGDDITDIYTISVSKDPGADEDDEDFDAYVRVGESKIIYKITADEYNNMMAASYNDLRHEEIVNASFDNISAITVTLDGETYEITSKGKSGKYTYYYDDEEVDLTNLKTAVTDLTADKFTSKEAEKKEEIAFTFTIDNGKQIELTLYRYDGEQCIAALDGESIALVDRASVVDIIESINEIIL